MAVCRKITWVAMIPINPITTRTRPSTSCDSDRNKLTLYLAQIYGTKFFFELQCNQACITLIQIPYHTSSVLLYLEKYLHIYMCTCKSYVYLCICGGHKRSSIIQIRYGNIMIILIQALYNQNSNLYMYAYIHHPKVFTSQPHTPTTISVHNSLIDSFLLKAPRNDSEILILVNSEQDVPISIMSS